MTNAQHKEIYWACTCKRKGLQQHHAVFLLSIGSTTTAPFGHLWLEVIMHLCCICRVVHPSSSSTASSQKCNMMQPCHNSQTMEKPLVPKVSD